MSSQTFGNGVEYILWEVGISSFIMQHIEPCPSLSKVFLPFDGDAFKKFDIK